MVWASHYNIDPQPDTVRFNFFNDTKKLCNDNKINIYQNVDTRHRQYDTHSKYMLNVSDIKVGIHVDVCNLQGKWKSGRISKVDTSSNKTVITISRNDYYDEIYCLPHELNCIAQHKTYVCSI